MPLPVTPGSPVHYEGTRREKARIQAVIDEWLGQQPDGGARHSGEVRDGAAGDLLVSVSEHSRRVHATDDSEASVSLAAYLLDYGWSARAVTGDCVVEPTHEASVYAADPDGLTRIKCGRCRIYDVDPQAIAFLKQPDAQVDRKTLSEAIAMVQMFGGVVTLDIGMISRLTATPRLADGTLDREPLKSIAKIFPARRVEQP